MPSLTEIETAARHVYAALTGGNIDRDVYARVLEDTTRGPGLV
jgi:hypothetical protein